ncbi:MAG: hypothetical protein HY805_09430 [Nitrospirae bacterium]|nr:hypothetical protein [Nitrospirota bacterium]
MALESVSFQPPSTPEPKTEGEYILVFSGTMGEEQGAIVGKRVLVGCEPTITIVNEDGTQAKDTMLRNQSNDYKVTGCLGSVEWSVSGTGGSITSEGVLTAGSSACGSLGITATCPKCGTSDTKYVRVPDAGQWEPIGGCSCAFFGGYSCQPVWYCDAYIGKYLYRSFWLCFELVYYSCINNCEFECIVEPCWWSVGYTMCDSKRGYGVRLYKTEKYEWVCP